MSAAPASKPSRAPAQKHLRASDLRGVLQLAVQATTGASHIAEGVHQSVWSTLGVAGGRGGARTGGVTGLIYSTVRGIAQMAGFGVDKLLAALQPLLASADAAPAGSPQREAVLAALNGVMGDRLSAANNPLATPMTLRYQGEALRWGALPAGFKPGGKVLLMIHGLCMNDLQWSAEHEGKVHDHGQALAAALGYTPVYLRYNTGLHISANGRALAAHLAQLVEHWPVAVEQIAVVAHSMGGLVMRAAVHCAQQEGGRWLSCLRHIVFLGTPHHGAPLERAGRWVDVLLGSTPYTRPFVRLTTLRSAGITDLRYGFVRDEDWMIPHDRVRKTGKRAQDQRAPPNPAQRPLSGAPLGLPPGVLCYTVAAAVAGRRSLLAERLTGDGLVPLRSALGQHDDAARTLRFEKPAQAIFYRMNHMALLSRPEVTAQLLAWLAPQRA